MTLWTLSTNPIARFFKKETVVTVDNNGIRIVQAEKETIISWDELDCPPNLSLSIDGGRLTLSSQGKIHSYRMLGYFTPFKYAKRFFPFWANHNAECLQDFLSDAYIQCTSTFLRDSSVENIRSFVRKEIKRWKGWDKVEGLSDLAHKTATQLSNIHHWTSRRYANVM